RGVKLSGGQRQRIALARAFLKDSPILILDEPTSSVDAKTEAAIVDALERLKQGRTVIVISHRPTTLAGCSALLTIDGGRVVADTTPAAVEALPAPAPPSRIPTRALSEKRRERLLAPHRRDRGREVRHAAPGPPRRSGAMAGDPAHRGAVRCRPGRIAGWWTESLPRPDARDAGPDPSPGQQSRLQRGRRGVSRRPGRAVR